MTFGTSSCDGGHMWGKHVSHQNGAVAAGVLGLVEGAVSGGQEFCPSSGHRTQQRLLLC
jgi:hypothetical protein